MPNRWIVCSHPYYQHETPEAAFAEAERVHKLTGKEYTVYRIKTNIQSDELVLEVPSLAKGDDNA